MEKAMLAILVRARNILLGINLLSKSRSAHNQISNRLYHIRNEIFGISAFRFVELLLNKLFITKKISQHNFWF